MAAAERPVHPVPETYVPPAGIRHPVTAGESWVALAQRHGIDSWDLIDFNFPGTRQTKQTDFQLATRHVNWYLREYVGCTVDDGQNLSFSSGLTRGRGVWKGGVIYLPPRGAPTPTPARPTPSPPPERKPPRCEMRRPDYYRLLNPREWQLVTKVFGKTLPPWKQIGIGNGLGAGGAPWTYEGYFDESVHFPQTPDVRYAINIGDLVSEDLTSRGPTMGWLCGDFGTVCGLLVHEMTHVWQYFHGVAVARKSAHAQTIGAGYSYTPGDPWDSYNVEQQAHIVEDWHDRGWSKTDILYPYIRLVIRSGGYRLHRSKTLAELRDLLITLIKGGYD